MPEICGVKPGPDYEPQEMQSGDEAMPSIHVDAVVGLKEDDPTHQLRRGDRGVVVSVWLSSSFLCEVEFRKSAGSPAVRALLRAEQLEIVDSQPPEPAKS
jgi:hypothetical protein